MNLPLSVLVLAFTLTVGCSSTVQSDGGADARSDATSSDACPASIPNAGAACTRAGLVCEFGDDPRVACRARATCSAGSWTISNPSCATLSACTDPSNTAGQACSTMDATCGYANMACTCTNCGPPYPVQMCSGAPTWHCAGAPVSVDMGCPSPIANLGTSCSTEGLLCRYDCEGTLARTCTGGLWVSTPQQNMCPVSTRSAKRDVHYLGADEIDGLARQAENTPLATYEYIDPSQPRGRHLGFIIEDQPRESFAVAPDRGHVDLYGYTSMLLAAVQSQQRQIAAMQVEIEQLRSASTRSDQHVTAGSPSPLRSTRR